MLEFLYICYHSTLAADANGNDVKPIYDEAEVRSKSQLVLGNVTQTVFVPPLIVF